MTKKTPARVRIAPFQRIIAEPITDPAELAALDKLLKRQKGKQTASKGKPGRRNADARKRP